MKASRSIRVNFRFGPRTDPELMREISSLPPYRRARLLRKILEIGWRARNAPTHYDAKPPTDQHTAVPAAVPQEADQTDFAQDILDLLGKSVRV